MALLPESVLFIRKIPVSNTETFAWIVFGLVLYVVGAYGWGVYSRYGSPDVCWFEGHQYVQDQHWEECCDEYPMPLGW